MYFTHIETQMKGERETERERERERERENVLDLIIRHQQSSQLQKALSDSMNIWQTLVLHLTVGIIV